MKITHPLHGDYPITGRFEKRTPIFIDGVWTLPFHYGVDWAAPDGTPIYAAANGTVRTASWDSSGYGGGWRVILDHPEGWSTHYLHMNQRPSLFTGEFVTRGQRVGYVGSTGLSTGAHLHFELQEHGVAVDPLAHIVSDVPDSGRPVFVHPEITDIGEDEMKLWIADVNGRWYLVVPTGSGKPNGATLPGDSGMGGGGAARAGIPVIRFKDEATLKRVVNI